MSKPNIKLFVVCHKPSYVPENELLCPIQVGAAIANERLPGMLHDDEGDNISEKNKSYCELTAHYWAWKNVEADYYGFFHYRRYLSFDPTDNSEDEWGNLQFDSITDEAIKQLKLNEKDMTELISQYDIIVTRGRKMDIGTALKGGKTVYKEYGVAPFQHREDFDKCLEILYKKYPEYKDVAQRYINGNEAHECNMFIMSKELFNEYCEWLFDILFETEKVIDTTYYSVEEYRIYGYLAERLTAIFYRYVLERGDKKCLEVAKSMFVDTDPMETLEPVYDKAVPIVLSANDAFSPYLDIMIRSIVENVSADNNYDIVVLYSDINDRNQKLIKQAADGRNNVSIRFVKVSKYFDVSKLFVDQHLSVETYFRLIIPELMPGYSKILYLDCDMVVDDDVAKLYNMNMGDALIGAAKDIDVAGQINLKQNKWDEYAVKKLGLDSPYDYFQAGVLILNLDEIRKVTTSDKLIKLATENDFRCHDQDVLNVACKNKVFYIPQEWNTLMSWAEPGRSRMDILKYAPRDLFGEYQNARNNPKIIHFAGYQKPWQLGDCDMATYFWKYARKSPYYEMLIRRIWDFNYERDRKAKEGNAPKVKMSFGKRVILWFLPYGSKRREGIKKIYHIFR